MIASRISSSLRVTASRLNSKAGPTFARRSALTVPRAATEEQMKRDAIEQIKARIARQKEIVEGTHRPHAEEVEEMWKWIKISIMVATPICVLSFIKDQLLAHPHRLDGPEPDYMKIRTKAFPWECDDCELFNTECWNKCRAEKAGIAYEGGHH